MSDVPPPPGWNQPPPPPGGGASPPAGYIAYSPYAGGGATREHPQGTTILVLGILSLVICGLLGPFAWSMGTKARREMDADRSATYTNRGSINAGRICGIISTCLLILAVVVIVIAIAASSGSG